MYIIQKFHRDTPDEVLLADLRKTAKKLGKKYLTLTEYTANGKFHGCTIYKRFGSWVKASVKAGLVVNKKFWVSDDELLENLKKVWDKLGRQPRYMEMGKPRSAYGKRTYINHFGSWNGALDAFAKYVNRKTKSPGCITYKRTGRKKRRNKKSTHIGIALRYAVFKRDKFRCKCGRSPATHPGIVLHVDHKKPRAKDGETTIENLETLCNLCNVGKGAS